MISLWHQIVTVRRAPPDPTRWATLRSYTWSAICVFVGFLYLYVYTLGYLRGVAASNPISIGMYSLRACLIIGVAFWALHRLTWRETNPTEQRQGQLIATVYALLIGTITLAVFITVGPASPLQKLTYYASLLTFASQGLLIVRQGHIRAGGIILLLGFVVEIMGSVGIDNPQRQAFLPILYALAVLVAVLLVRWQYGLLLAIGLPCISTVLQEYELVPTAPNWPAAFAYAVYLTTVAGIAALYVNSVEEQVRIQSHALIEATQELESANRQLQAYATQAADLATLEERNRIAREIHDGLGHHLMNVVQLLKGSRTVLAADPSMAHESIEEAHTVAKEALNEVRRSVGTLRGSPLEQRSLSEVVTSLVQKTSTDGINATCTILGELRTLPLPVAETLYRVIQEALTNMRKHAEATQAVVQFDYRDPQRVRVLIEDNGKGSDHPHGGFGLIGMRERIRQVDGTITMETAPGQGFRIQVEVPA